MTWLLIALISYFLSSLVIILDKFILSGRKTINPPVYSFYIAVLGLFSLIFAPLGWTWPPLQVIIVSLVSGIFFTFGILSLYYAIQAGQASRVATFTGAVIPLFSFFISTVFLEEKLLLREVIGALLLISGGILVTFDLPLKTDRRKFWIKFKYALLSGVLLAIAFSVFKYVYENQVFISGFIWTRFGSAIAVAAFFLVPSWRRDIIRSLKSVRRPSSEHKKTGALIVLNKIIGGTASILFNYALKLGSVTLVNALVSSQYVFILIFASLFSIWRPEIFQEKLFFWDWVQKITAISLVAVGVYLISPHAEVMTLDFTKV